MKIGYILQKVINENITIELKNGIVICGTVMSSDKFMNIFLKNVKKRNMIENNLNLDSLSIRGNMIRYLILPVWINFDSVLFYRIKNIK